MPLRGLMYFGNLYDKYVEESRQNIYGSRLIKIPTPRHVIFYNGAADKPSVMKLKLSEAFIHPSGNGEFEWTATMMNLNKGKNPELLAKCKVLSDYMELINKIRYYKKEGKDIGEAVDQAVTECIDGGILSDFLLAHRAEVLMMCLTEFNEKTYRDEIFEEGKEEGRQEGRQEGREEGKASILTAMLQGGNTPEKIADLTGLPLEEICSILGHKITE